MLIFSCFFAILFIYTCTTPVIIYQYKFSKEKTPVTIVHLIFPVSLQSVKFFLKQLLFETHRIIDFKFNDNEWCLKRLLFDQIGYISVLKLLFSYEKSCLHSLHKHALKIQNFCHSNFYVLFSL